VLFYDNTVRIAPIGYTSNVLIWRVVGESRIRTELFETDPTLRTVTIRINHAADCSKVAGLKLGHCGAHLGNTADYLMSRNAWIDSWHCTPFVTDRVKVRMTDTAEKDFYLNVVFARIASWDRSWIKWRFRIRSSISLCFVLPTRLGDKLGC
jgi:hypothetical protein